MDLGLFIRNNTEGFHTVVDMGAGTGDKLSFVHPTVTRKIAVEIFPAYWSIIPKEYTAVMRDMREYAHHIPEEYRCCAMLIDSLEHIAKDSGKLFLEDLKANFKKVLVFTPLGFHSQEVDVTGMNNPYQVHQCGWMAQELSALGFVVEEDPGFHGPRGGALFAVYTCQP